jgi:antitoxin HicB
MRLLGKMFWQENNTMEGPMDAREILKRPYARVLTPETDGQYSAEIMEFPNCVASGANAVEALANLEQVAAEWIAASIEQGQDIPDPMDNAEYSGRFVLRTTKGLHRRAVLLAEREGVSLNKFVNTCLAEAVGERSKPQFVYTGPQMQALASFSFQVGATVGPTNPYGPALGSSGVRQITTSGSGAIMPVRDWRELERQHA